MTQYHLCCDMKILKSKVYIHRAKYSLYYKRCSINSVLNALRLSDIHTPNLQQKQKMPPESDDIW